jgi:UDP-N-acetyl-D-galactosamine dehydrogenase
LELNYKIAIIGQGYVGLPLAISFSKFYDTIGYDTSLNRIDELNREYDRNLENEVKANKLLNFSCNKDDIKDCNIFI